MDNEKTGEKFANEILKEAMKKEGSEETIKGILKFFFGIFIVISAFGLGFINAIFFVDMWNWFVNPVINFEMTYWHGMGILAFSGLIRLKPNMKKDDEESLPLYEIFIKLITYEILVLAIWGWGYLIQGWM